MRWGNGLGRRNTCNFMTSVSMRRFVEYFRTCVSPSCIRIDGSVLIILTCVGLMIQIQEGCRTRILSSLVNDDLSAGGDSHAALDRNVPFSVATNRRSYYRYATTFLSRGWLPKTSVRDKIQDMKNKIIKEQFFMSPSGLNGLLRSGTVSSSLSTSVESPLLCDTVFVVRVARVILSVAGLGAPIGSSVAFSRRCVVSSRRPPATGADHVALRSPTA